MQHLHNYLQVFTIIWKCQPLSSTPEAIRNEILPNELFYDVLPFENYLWPCVCHKSCAVEFNVLVYILMSKQHVFFSAGIFLPVSTQNMIRHISLSTRAPSSVSFFRSCLSFMEYGYLASTNTDTTNWILDLQPTLDLHLPVSSDQMFYGWGKQNYLDLS